MTTRFRLTAAAEALLERPLEERVSYVKALPPSGYSSANKALDALEDLMKHPQVSRMPNLLIYGDTNNGKTTIAEAFLARHPSNDDIHDDYISSPVVMVQAPPGGEESRLYSGILRRLYSPLMPPKRLDQMSFEVKRQLEILGTRMLIIDEFQATLNAGKHGQRKFLSAIKWLGNELKIPIVAFGTADALNAINTDMQIANRFERLELHRWAGNAEYLRCSTGSRRPYPFDVDRSYGKLRLLMKSYRWATRRSAR